MKKVLAPFLSLNTASAFLNVVVKRTFYVALFLCFVVNGFGQTVGWAVKGGGSGNDVGLGVAHDANGNVFVTGYFAGNASFGSTTLTSAGSNDIFLTKYNASGNVIWAKGFGSSGDDQGLAVSVTSTNEVVISGVFSNTVSFGTNSVSSSGSYDMFVCKLDNDGNALWTKKGGGTGGDYGWSVACNDAGSVFVGGSFASATASFGSTTLTSSGGTDVFVAEYDLNGNFVQAKNAGSSGEDLAYAIHTHGAHTCLYLAGRFSGTASFSGNTVVSSGAEDAFVAHFEMSTGVFDWVRKMGGSGSESAQGVSTDADCNVYVAGQYSNNCDFGGTVNTTAGDRDAFVAKWDELGNFVYVNTGGGSGYDYASGVDVDDLGNVYITGFISTTATFGSTSLTSNGAIDIFTARYKPDGSFDYATSFGGTGSEYGRTISADNAGNSFVTGPFAGTVNFGGTSLTSSGGQDVYLVKQKKDVDTWICGTDILLNKERLESDFQEKETILNDIITEKLQSTNNLNSVNPISTSAEFVIPIVVHVVTNNTMSYVQVESQIDALNRAFSRNYSSYNNAAVDTKIQFCLASNTSPSTLSWTNSSEPGVMRYTAAQIGSLNIHDMKVPNTLVNLTNNDWNSTSPTIFPFKNYLNIWIVDRIDEGSAQNKAAGYATFPGSTNSLQGIVMNRQYFGDNSSGAAYDLNSNNSEGKVLAHEAGHYLSLYHIFEKGCAGLEAPSSNFDDCLHYGDKVCDTPPCTTQSINCNAITGVNSCTETYNAAPDLLNDFMSYAHDPCWNTFTDGQRTRMQTTLLTLRSDLVTSFNQANTGIAKNGGCLPKILTAEVLPVGDQTLCFSATNKSITLTNPIGSGYAATTWTWTLPTNASTTGSLNNNSITIEFSAIGNYTVTLKVTDGTNTDTRTFNIFVLDCTLNTDLIQNSQWHFGFNARLDFSTGSAKAVTTPSKINSQEACASITSNTGDLLFYTDGVRAWNKNGDRIYVDGQTTLMEMHGSINFPNPGNVSSTQGAMIIPDPSNSNRYYIFTTPDQPTAATHQQGTLEYSIVDMTKNNNLGAFVEFNTPIHNKTIPASNEITVGEALTAIPHCNGLDYWIITREVPSKSSSSSATSANIVTYLLTSKGILGPYISNSQYNITRAYSTTAGIYSGRFEVSPDGNIVLSTSYETQNGYLYTFDKSTGLLTYQTTITGIGNGVGYSFSPDSKYLYCMRDANTIDQYDVSGLPNVAAPNSISNTTNVTTSRLSAMQLGPDGKIYIATSSWGVKTAVINLPNNIASTAANIGFTTSIDLTTGQANRNGYPNLVDAVKSDLTTADFSITRTSCSTIQCNVDACWRNYTTIWNFGDNTTIYTGNSISHTYSASGNYNVTLTLKIGSNTFATVVKSISILKNAPSITGPISVCLGINPTNYSVPFIEGATYTWTVSNGSFSTGTDASSIDVTWNAAGAAVITVDINYSTCQLTANKSITINPSPIANAGLDIIYSCQVNPTLGGSPTATGGTSPYTYSWTPSTFLSSTTAANPGLTNYTAPINYTLTVTDNKGCFATDNVNVTGTSTNTPIANFTFDEFDNYQGKNVLFTNSSSNGISYIWDFDDGSATITTSSPTNQTHVFAFPGFYHVLLTASNGGTCIDVLAKDIYIIPSITNFTTAGITYNYNANGCACTAANSFFSNIGGKDYSTHQNITSNLTWSGTMKIKGTVTINPNCTLTVAPGARIEFGPQGKIIVRERANMIVNNATLTSIDYASLCGGTMRMMWQGIEVWGNELSPAVNQQGRIIIQNNALIEDAFVAITSGKNKLKSRLEPNEGYDVFGHENGYGGGILTISNSNFNRNGINIRIYDYKFKNLSSIINNVFDTKNGSNVVPLNDLFYKAYINGTGTYSSGGNIYFHNPFLQTISINLSVYSKMQSGIEILNTSGIVFQDNKVNNSYFGIELFDGGVTTAVGTNTVSNVINSDYAVYINYSSSSILKFSTIKNNTFNSKSNGVVLSGSNAPNLINNNIIKSIGSYNITNTTTGLCNGIYVGNASNFKIVDNELNNWQRGVQVNNANTFPSLVGYENKGNSFIGCGSSISTGANNSKLKLRCNNFNTLTNYGTAVWNIGGSALMQQGEYSATDQTKPSGNSFAIQDPNSNNKKDINSIPVFNYYGHGNTNTKVFQATNIATPTKALLDFSSVNATDFNIACKPSLTSSSSCMPLCGRIAMQQNSNQTAILQNEYLAVEQTLDGGSGGQMRIATNSSSYRSSNCVTQCLIDAIQSANSNWSDLKALLQDASPLSDAVLTVLVQKQNPVVPYGILKDVLQANMPSSPQIWALISNRITCVGGIDCIPKGIARQLLQWQAHNPGVRTLTAINRDMYESENQREEMLSLLLEYYVGNDMQTEAIALLEDEINPEVRKALLATYIESGNYTSAQTELDNQPVDNQENIAFKQLYGLYLQLGNEGRTIWDLTEVEVQMVRDIAGLCPIELATENAKNLLFLLRRESVADCGTDNARLIVPENSLETTSVADTYFDGVKDQSVLGTNIPNPFEQTTEIPYFLPLNQVGRVEITTVAGVKIKKFELLPGNHKIRLEATDLAGGVYLYTLYVNNQPIDTKRMIIVK